MSLNLPRASLALVFAAACNGQDVEQPILSGSSTGAATSTSGAGNAPTNNGSGYSGSSPSASSSGSSGSPPSNELDAAAGILDATMTDAEETDASISDAASEATAPLQCTYDAGDAAGMACAMEPAAAVSPPSSASGSNITGQYGQTIAIQDGYAVLVEATNSGPLYTSYTSSLSFTFTDYPNALGYAITQSTKEGSRVLTNQEPAYTLTSTTEVPQFTAGTYNEGYVMVANNIFDGIQWELYGFTSNCQSQDELVSAGGPELTITSISNSRIQGSIGFPAVVDGSTGGFKITFDIPLVVSCGSTQLGVVNQCCLP